MFPEWIVMLLAGAVVIAAIVVQGLRRRRRRRNRVPRSVRPGSEIQEDGEAGELPAPPSPFDPANLESTVAPDKFTQTLATATLNCRVSVINRGERILSALRVSADMIAPHGPDTGTEQLRGPDMDNAQVERIARLDPGESTELPFEFRLDLDDVKPLRQGEAEMMLPMVRLRVLGAGLSPQVRHYAVGQPSPTGRLQPLRTDEGPHTTTELAARAIET